MTRRNLAAASAAAILLTAAPAAEAAGGADYLRSRLTASGGFAEAGSSTPSTSLTQWAVMGLRAAGKDPNRWRLPGGRSPNSYLAAKARGWSDAYQLARGILAVVALGRNPENYGGRDLIRALRAKRAPNGRYGQFANSTYWAVLALRGARERVGDRTVAYIRAQQRSNGGYSWTRTAPTDTNDTAAAIMALRSAGARCSSRAVAGGLRYLTRVQRPSRGYPLLPGNTADSQSTAWAIQARRKCRLPNRGALDFLAARQLPSGAFNYQKGVTRTPAWVTAQVLPATNGRSYPIRP